MRRAVIVGVMMMAVCLALVVLPAHAGSWNGWVYQNPYPTSNILLAVKFVSPQKGWIAGERGIILYTEDGGESWKAQESGVAEDLKSIVIEHGKIPPCGH